MDPITIIATALATGAAAGLKPTAEQAIRDAYAGLKAFIARKYKEAAPSLDQLEAAPHSKARRGVVEEDLGRTGAVQDTELVRQAQILLNAVLQYAPETARTIGVDLQDIKAGSLKLGNILAQSAGSVTGVTVKGAEVAGELSITDVTAKGE